jgi:hypothetical protein
MENGHFPSQVRRRFAQRKLGHHCSSLRRQVNITNEMSRVYVFTAQLQLTSSPYSVQPDDLLLRMGEYDLATDEEEYPYIERKVQIVASHPQFDSRTFEYDLALLRFYDPVRFQPNIVPICLPPPSEVDFVGRTAYVTGWGRLYEGKNIWNATLKNESRQLPTKTVNYSDGPLPSKMQQVSVPVINNTDCENMYRRAGYVEHIPNIFICAGYADGKRDSCEVSLLYS